MTEADHLERIWALADKIGFCMLSTLSGGEILSRPMTAFPSRDDNVFYFLTGADSLKDEEIEDNANVGLAFADPSAQEYVSIAGTASLSNDRAKIRDLWSAPLGAWWDGPEDPTIRLLTVQPRHAHFWDSPGTVASYVKMLAAAFTNTRPELGKSGGARM